MTDEEKIKRAKDIICKNCKWNECDNNACPTLQETIKAIELGLAEGRKEGYELGYNEKFENTCMKAEEFDKYLELVKENEQLIKESIQTEIEFAEARDKISELEKEIDSYKAFESHYEEIEEDAKVIAKENEQLKERIREIENDSNNCEHWSYTRIKQLEEQIEKMKCCFTCKHKNDCVIEDYNNVCEKWE